MDSSKTKIPKRSSKGPKVPAPSTMKKNLQGVSSKSKKGK